MKEERRQGYRDNRQRIIDHLKTKGLSNAAIAGIVGNIDIETGGTFDYKQRQTKSGNPRDPNVTPGGAYGLFQFDDPGKKAGHETWYKQYLEKTNKTDSAESQLDYFLDTINAAADKQNPFYSFSENVGTGNTGTIKGYFQLSEDPKTVSDSITDRFLKPGKPKSDKRRASAEATFAELQPVDPDNQNIDQPGDIVDTGDDVPLPEIEERRFQNVPILRHFFAEGGVPMKKQMEMFEDGGLMDEGGTVDPVSGNDVPFGSMQEEVRDDIPAQLSEGEFVFPADVVRFIGLNNLMQMRQQAKMGLKEMEAMGQMGNSEEATMPDNLPFDINDLDMEDDMDYNTPQEFNVGGMPNPQSGVFYQPATAPTTGVYQPPQMSVAPVQAASAQFVAPPRPQQVTTPMIQYQKPDIPFQEFIGGGVEGVEVETVQYKNEAGDIITRRVNKSTGEIIPGQPPIPDGYVKFDPNEVKPEDVTTTPTTPTTTTGQTGRVLTQEELRDRDDADKARADAERARFGNTSHKIGLANFYPDGRGQTFGVNLIGYAAGPAGYMQFMRGKHPEGSMILLKDGDLEYYVEGSEYETIKEDIAKSQQRPGVGRTQIYDYGDGSSGRTRQILKDAVTREVVAGIDKDYADITGDYSMFGDEGFEDKGKSNVLTFRASDYDDPFDVDSLNANLNLSPDRKVTFPRGGPDYRKSFLYKDKDPESKRLEEQQQRATSDAGEAAAQQASMYQQQDDDGTSNYGEDTTSGYASEENEYGPQDISQGYMQQGGLVSKKKPKAKKKMKRGGLASKK